MKRILLLPNLLETALGIIAGNIKKFWDYKKYPAKIDILPTDQLLRDPATGSDYDVIFPMYYVDAIPISKLFQPEKIITGIHSHNIWDKNLTTPERDIEPPDDLCAFLNSIRGVNVVSKRLFKIFSPRIKNIQYTRCGVDTSVFYRMNDIRKDPFTVGWVGNTNPDYQRGAKGFYDIVKPLSDKMKGINFKFADWFKSIITQNEMNDFYNSLDVLIIASLKEGQPMPPVEAAACGVPTISTNVGIIPELIKNGINGYIIHRDFSEFESKLNYLQSDRSLLKEMQENCTMIINENWKWELVINQWMSFISAIQFIP
jgi:glycosyltransferase involved in cell wall biosynthesis